MPACAPLATQYPTAHAIPVATVVMLAFFPQQSCTRLLRAVGSPRRGPLGALLNMVTDKRDAPGPAHRRHR